MQIANVQAGERCVVAGQLPDIGDGVEMIDRFQVVLERFAGNGDAVFDNHRGLDGGEGVSLDCVRRAGEFEVVRVVEICRAAGRADGQLIEFSLLGGNGGK